MSKASFDSFFQCSQFLIPYVTQVSPDTACHGSKAVKHSHESIGVKQMAAGMLYSIPCLSSDPNFPKLWF